MISMVTPGGAGARGAYDINDGTRGWGHQGVLTPGALMIPMVTPGGADDINGNARGAYTSGC